MCKIDIEETRESRGKRTKNTKIVLHYANYEEKNRESSLICQQKWQCRDQLLHLRLAK